MRLTILFLLAASSWGQPPASVYTAPVGRPEDSPSAAATNLIFYDNPRGLQPAQTTPASAVPLEQLQHPLSSKAIGLLRKAESLANKGLHDKAIAQLERALKERSAIPYAHSMLGQEYLKLKQIPAAIAELEQALTALPRNVATRSNLGYALLLAGDLERSERETRKALDLDPANPMTRHVLDQILLARRDGNDR